MPWPSRRSDVGLPTASAVGKRGKRPNCAGGVQKIAASHPLGFLEVQSLLFADCACPSGTTPCTDLLFQPARVLRDRRLWPTNLCGDAFLRESTRRWFSRTALLAESLGYPNDGYATWALERVAEAWPLPVGRQAINLRAAMFEGDTAAFMAAARMAPFEGPEEAMWAVRVATSGNSLELFGLADPSAGAGQPKENRPVSMGELRFVLRGSDTSLVDLARAAGRWWADFRGLRVQGRPPNSGAWADAVEFKDALRTAITALREEGRVATQQEVTTYFSTRPGVPGCNDRQLRRWLARYGAVWQDFLTSE